MIDAKMRPFSEKPTAVGIAVYTELGEKKEPARDTLQAFLDDGWGVMEKVVQYVPVCAWSAMVKPITWPIPTTSG